MLPGIVSVIRLVFSVTCVVTHCLSYQHHFIHTFPQIIVCNNLLFLPVIISWADVSRRSTCVTFCFQDLSEQP